MDWERGPREGSLSSSLPLRPVRASGIVSTSCQAVCAMVSVPVQPMAAFGCVFGTVASVCVCVWDCGIFMLYVLGRGQ